MAKDSTATHALYVIVPEELHARLRSMAEARDRSVSAETRRAIEARLREFDEDRAAA